jgi:hypothetical protein
MPIEIEWRLGFRLSFYYFTFIVFASTVWADGSLTDFLERDRPVALAKWPSSEQRT